MAWPGSRCRSAVRAVRCVRPVAPAPERDGAIAHHGHGFASRIQAGAVRELAILHTAGDHMEALFSRAGIKRKMSSRGRPAQSPWQPCKQRLGRQRRGNPALRFLVRQVAQIVRDGAAPLRVHTSPLTRPGSCRSRRPPPASDAAAPAAVTLADFPEPASAFGPFIAKLLAGILDRQPVAFHRRRRTYARAVHHTLSCHLGVGENRSTGTSWPRTPFASRRRHRSLSATMHLTSAAPFYRDDHSEPSHSPVNLRQHLTPLPAECRHSGHTDPILNPGQARFSPSHQISPPPSAHAGDDGCGGSRPYALCADLTITTLSSGPARRFRLSRRMPSSSRTN